jgi:hypothetical protein
MIYTSETRVGCVSIVGETYLVQGEFAAGLKFAGPAMAEDVFLILDISSPGC